MDRAGGSAGRQVEERVDRADRGEAEGSAALAASAASVSVFERGVRAFLVGEEGFVEGVPALARLDRPQDVVPALAGLLAERGEEATLAGLRVGRVARGELAASLGRPGLAGSGSGLLALFRFGGMVAANASRSARLGTLAVMECERRGRHYCSAREENGEGVGWDPASAWDGVVAEDRSLAHGSA